MSEAEKYRAALEKDPGDIQAFMNLCRIAERDGDFHYLAELYKYRAQVARDQQEIGDLYYKAAEIFLDKLDDTTAGIEALLEGFEHDRTHAGIGDRLDSIYRDAEDWEATLQVLEQRIDALGAADVNGTKLTIRSDLHQQVGEILDRVYNEKEKALIEYRKAIDLDKTNVLALYGAREVYYAASQFKNAAKLCELEARAEKDTERRIALYLELGHILATHLEDPIQAVMAIKRALKCNPENEEVKRELAEAIALSPLSEETQKDHHWASDYLLRLASQSESAEALELARMALLALPDNPRAIESIDNLAKTSSDPEVICDFYKAAIEASADLNTAAPVIRMLAKHYISELGRPEDALDWLRKIASLGNPEDARAIAQLERGVAARTSQAPPAVATDLPSKPAAGLPPGLGLIGPRANGSDTSSATEQTLAVARRHPVESVKPASPSLSSAPPARTKKPSESMPPPEGVSSAEWVTQLHLQADAARRSGDDATAEERMVAVLECSPHDQRATTFLERRFRAQSDWQSLRDLLMRAAGSPSLPAAVQTVRLREAARLSEEQLGDPLGAILAWQKIHEYDPKVRDAVDALARLLAEACRWEELLEIIREEAETTKSKAKSIEAYHRMADIFRVHLTDMESAAEAYSKVLELSPNDVPALEALDELYLREQRWSDLVPLLRHRAELARERDVKRDLMLRAARVLEERLMHHDPAYVLAKEILAFSPRDDETLELMESIDETLGHWARLLSVLDMRVQAAEDPAAKTVILRKKAFIAAHRLTDVRVAIKAWREVLDLLPGDQEALDSLSTIYKDSGDYRELVAVWRDSLNYAKSDLSKADLYRQMARVLESELDAADQAMECWRHVVEIDEDVESLGALSRYYERIGDWAELVQVLGRQAPYAETQGQQADILYKRALLLAERLGDQEQSERDLGQIIAEVDPSHGPTLELLRRFYVDTNRYEKAAETLEQQISYAEDPLSTVPLLVQLGDWAHHELGDVPRAMDAFERAAVLCPDETDVLDTLEEIYVELAEWDRQLKLLYGRSKRTEDAEEKKTLLLRGAHVCEERLEDPVKSWTWYRELFDALWQQPGTLELVVDAATTHNLWRELIDVYGIMVGRTADEVEQVSLWIKVADILEEQLAEPAQALEAVLRAFGLRPDEANLLDRVDRLAVASSAWQRLATVYGVLAKRAPEPAACIQLLVRYANVLFDPGQQASAAFDVSLRAFEIDPHSEELLVLVEQMATASLRYEDMVRVYGVCGRLATDRARKADLALRAFRVTNDHLGDPDGAMGALVEALLASPFDPSNVDEVWKGVASLEADQLLEASGSFWRRLVETYVRLVDENRNDRPRKVELLMATARIYIEHIKDTAAGFSCLKKAHALDPKDQDAIDELEEVAKDYGLWKELTDHYRDVLDETFEMTVATMLHRRRARILEDVLGRPEAAAEHYWQIIQLDSSDRAGFEKLLAYYEQATKWNELVNLLERQLDTLSSSDEKRQILLRIAKTWEDRIGNRFEAKDWYEQVLVLYPGDAVAEASLARLSGGRDRVVVAEPLEEGEDEELRELISISPAPYTESRPPESPVPAANQAATQVASADVSTQTSTTPEKQTANHEAPPSEQVEDESGEPEEEKKENAPIAVRDMFNEAATLTKFNLGPPKTPAKNHSGPIDSVVDDSSNAVVSGNETDDSDNEIPPFAVVIAPENETAEGEHDNLFPDLPDENEDLLPDLPEGSDSDVPPIFAASDDDSIGVLLSPEDLGIAPPKPEKHESSESSDETLLDELDDD